MTAPGRLRGLLPHAWSVLLPVLLLGPALGPGYVLTYDMVWVPQLALRGDAFGAGAGLPRAVPSDAVVALLDDVVPGMLLQKVVLLGALVLAGQGALRLVGPSTVARLTAISLIVWNPFVVERLGIGHWPVLLGYAVVPWLVVLLRPGPGAGPDAGPARPLPGALWFLVPLGCLSASAGVVTALVLLVMGLRPRVGARRRTTLLVLAVAGNAPWLVAGWLHAAVASRGAGAQVFALHGEGSVPAPLAALSLGGIWNSEVVPASRTGALGWVALLVLLLLVAAGARRWAGTVGRVEARRSVLLWGVGYAIAVLTWLAPGAVEQVASTVPGGGLVRDGARTLALCLPLLVGAAAAGAEVLTAALGTTTAPRVGVVLACVLLPVAVMTDVAWGLGGALRPAHFPASWAPARSALAAAHERADGDLLVLPFSSYRAPRWNHGHKVLDPLGRYLTPDYVVDDRLVVSGVDVAGDDPRVPAVRAGLARSTGAERAAALRAIGVRYVVEDLDPSVTRGVGVPVVSGDDVYRDDRIRVVSLVGPVEVRHHGAGWWTALLVAWAAYAAVLVVGVGSGLLEMVRRHGGRNALRTGNG